MFAPPFAQAYFIFLSLIIIMPSLIPFPLLKFLNSTFLSFFFVEVSYAVLSAASITPPAVPKISPAPEANPRTGSNSSSFKFTKSIFFCFINLPSSLVVRT